VIYKKTKLRRFDEVYYYQRYTNYIYIVTLATRLNVLAFARHTHEYTSALATRALTPDTIVRVEINRPQSLLRERRTLFQNC